MKHSLTRSSRRSETTVYHGFAVRVLLLCLLTAIAEESVPAGERSAGELNVLEAAARIEFEAIGESSGIAKSRRYPGVYWTHNDSGDRARIFAVDSAGALIRPEWAEDYEGLELHGAFNYDWEDLATDDEGNLLIGACGNNGNARRDLAVYVVPEPNPRAVTASHVLKRIPVAFPGQAKFPPQRRNFDCEAIFFSGGRLHFLSKNRSDSGTELYRLDPPSGGGVYHAWHEAFAGDRVYTLALVGSRDVRGVDPEVPGLVTAADCRPEGGALAVLCYRSVWLFEPLRGGFFEGRVSWLPIAAGQCEAICFDGERLVITNEQREIFHLPLAELLPYRP